MSGNDHLYREIGTLRAEIEEKDATIRQMRKQLTKLVRGSNDYPRSFNLTGQEAAALTALRASKGACSYSRLFAALGREVECRTKILTVTIFWLRRKVQHVADVAIDNVPGYGYQLRGKQALDQAMLRGDAMPTRKVIGMDRDAEACAS